MKTFKTFLGLVALSMAVVLTSCKKEDEKIDENKNNFVGTWVSEAVIPFEEGMVASAEMVFNADMTMQQNVIVTNVNKSQLLSILSASAKYSYDKAKLILTISLSEEEDEKVVYAFESATKLRLKLEIGGVEMSLVFNKQKDVVSDNPLVGLWRGVTVDNGTNTNWEFIIRHDNILQGTAQMVDAKGENLGDAQLFPGRYTYLDKKFVVEIGGMKSEIDYTLKSDDEMTVTFADIKIDLKRVKL